MMVYHKHGSYIFLRVLLNFHFIAGLSAASISFIHFPYQALLDVVPCFHYNQLISPFQALVSWH